MLIKSTQNRIKLILIIGQMKFTGIVRPPLVNVLGRVTRGSYTHGRKIMHDTIAIYRNGKYK